MLNHTPLRQTSAWADFLKHKNWKIKQINSENRLVTLYIKKIPLLGSVIKIQRQLNPLPIKEIEDLAKSERAVQITIEPYGNFKQEEKLKKYKYKPNKSPLLPPKTLLINLHLSNQDLLKQMHYSGRRGIRNAKKAPIQIRAVEAKEKNLANFTSTMKKRARSKGFEPADLKTIQQKALTFGEKSILLFAYSNSEFIGGVLGLGAEDTLHYHHAVTTKKGRKTDAAYLLIWELLLWGKKSGYHTFDFGGIADQRFPKTKSWQGFTEFKRKFGGEEVEWPHPWVKWRIPQGILPKLKTPKNHPPECMTG